MIEAKYLNSTHVELNFVEKNDKKNGALNDGIVIKILTQKRHSFR